MKTGHDVYAKINVDSFIVEVNSEIFIQNFDGWILIEENVTGDKGAHAQGNYLDKPIVDEQGRYNYKLVDGEVVEVAEEDKPEVKPIEPQPSDDTSVWDELDQAYQEGVDSV